MAAPTITYALTNGTTADASQVAQNFTDLLNGYTDGTKDLSISALTCAGTATLNGHINLGNSSADDLTITASLASTIPIKTNNSFNIGSATLGLAGVYLGNGGLGATCLVLSASHATTRSYTIPDCATAANFLMSELAQSKNGIMTFNNGIKVSSAGSTLATYTSGTTWTPVLAFSGGNSTSTIAINYAKYGQVGDFVTVDFAVTLTKSGTPSGNFILTGLPIAAVTATYYSSWAPLGQAVSSAAWVITVSSGETQLTFKTVGNANVTAADVSDAKTFRGTLVYRAV